MKSASSFDKGLVMAVIKLSKNIKNTETLNSTRTATPVHNARLGGVGWSGGWSWVGFRRASETPSSTRTATPVHNASHDLRHTVLAIALLGDDWEWKA